MFITSEQENAATALARLEAAVDGLLGIDTTRPTGEELLELLRGIEAQTSRLAAVDHALIAETETRGLARERACPSTAVLLRQLLRIGSREAGARVRAAGELGPRRGLTGQPLPPLFADAATAQTAGVLSPAQARILTRTITRLPHAIAAVHEVAAQQFLLEQAGLLDTDQLAQVAHHLAETLDPDGRLADEHDHERRRGIQIQQRPDGSVHGELELTAACGEALLSVFDTLARPHPETDGIRDNRPATQRRHDALHDLCLMAMRTDSLPAAGGITTTILLSMTEQQLRTRTGQVNTGHGAQISVEQALRMATDTRLVPIVFDNAKAVTAYGTSQRIFTETQRLAMTARDQGCSFPACTAPPLWCESHHVTDWADTHRTSIDDGTLLCGYHHREHHKHGWNCRMLNGIPHWTPPAWLDPHQQPRRNTAHNPALICEPTLTPEPAPDPEPTPA